MANEDEYYDSRMLLKQLIFNEEKKVWEILEDYIFTLALFL